VIEVPRALKAWVEHQLGSDQFTIAPLQGDASFRSYFRIITNNASYIAMFAPPGQEQTDIFVQIARAWKAHGLTVPTVLGWEPAQGFVLLSDFGDALLLDILQPHTVDQFYQTAMKNLVSLQSYTGELPLFNEQHIRRELSLFRDWFVEKLLEIKITPALDNLIENVNTQIIDIIQAQPQVAIHRDYHSRNLMVLPDKSLGIIDFQDAMIGPITYDLASLLKDCYIDWPRETVCQWVTSFANMLGMEKRHSIDPNEFLQWFDWVGLQRHLKVLGIFSRLKIRDHKPRYMQDIPRILNYVLEVTGHYPQLEEFDHWMRAIVQKRFNNTLVQVA
jgi:hypothetical protein